MKTIYKIVCLENNKVYIGQTGDYDKRKKTHMRNLKNNNHINTYLQEDYNKYGAVNFRYDVIEVVADECGNEREDYWMEYYGGIDSKATYNAMNSVTKSVFMREKLHNLYKGKSHIELYGKDKAEQMRDANSIKHKGKKAVYIPYKGKVKYTDGTMREVTSQIYATVHRLRNLGMTYEKISEQTGIKLNGVRNILLNNIYLDWKCND